MGLNFVTPLLDKLRPSIWFRRDISFRVRARVTERVSVPPSDYIPWMGGKTYVMNVQTKTNQDKEKALVYNHEEARVLAAVITTFNEHMECVVEEHGQQHVVTYSLKGASINLAFEPRPQLLKK